jgi:hypothetical protein
MVRLSTAFFCAWILFLKPSFAADYSDSPSLDVIFDELSQHGAVRENHGLKVAFTGPETYAYGHRELRIKAERRLLRIVSILKQYKSPSILIEGYATEPDLAWKRARYAHSLLVGWGIEPSRLQTSAYIIRHGAPSYVERRLHLVITETAFPPQTVKRERDRKGEKNSPFTH